MPRKFLNVLTGLGMGTFTDIECNTSQDKSRGQLSLEEYQLTNICKNTKSNSYLIKATQQLYLHTLWIFGMTEVLFMMRPRKVVLFQ